jgi:hypothetical protein
VRKTSLAVIGALIASPLASMASAPPASAAPPVGTCTQSYGAFTYDGLAFDPAAQAIFAALDVNGDGIVCFKPYPNGPHAGHAGNLVDDKAAPHA